MTFSFPSDKQNQFEYEFRWVYRSWTEMQKYEPIKWRTDLVVFIQNKEKYFNDEKFFLNELKCSFLNRRTSSSDKPMCTLIDYIPLNERILTEFRDKMFTNEKGDEKLLKYQFLLNKLNIFSDDPANLLPFYTLLQIKLSKYGYLDSILMAFDGYQYFKSAKFNFIVRSDMDVFLTPFFAKWLPK